MGTARTFETFEQEKRGSDKHVRVVTYNVFADRFATNGNNGHIPEEVLNWVSRGPRLLEEILSYSADILCLQEVERNMFEAEWSPRMEEAGYASIYFGRVTDDQMGEPEEGCILLYRLDKFICLQEVSRCFASIIPEVEGGQFWDKARGCKEGAAMALLECRGCRGKLIAATTHLHWDNEWPDLKAYQASLLCQMIAEVAGDKASKIPVVIGGDFNSYARRCYPTDLDQLKYGEEWPEGTYRVSGVYELMSGGELSPKHQHHPSQLRREAEDTPAALTTSGLNLSSVYASAPGSIGKEPPITQRTPRTAGCVDYIFVSPHCKVKGLLSMPYQGVLDPVDAVGTNITFPNIPNEEFPSDHLAVGCQLSLCK